MRRLFTAAVMMIFCAACSCSSSADKAKRCLSEGRGIQAYYWFLKSGSGCGKDEQAAKARALAVIELRSVFTKAKKIGSTAVYLDNEDKSTIDFILQNDPSLRNEL